MNDNETPEQERDRLIKAYVHTLRECGVPSHNHDGLAWYVVTGRPVGSFLQQVLCNNLCEAYGHADHINIHALPNLVRWLVSHCPMSARGVEGYEDWIKMGGLQGWNNEQKKEQAS
jgi:hypothetical protein